MRIIKNVVFYAAATAAAVGIFHYSDRININRNAPFRKIADGGHTLQLPDIPRPPLPQAVAGLPDIPAPIIDPLPKDLVEKLQKLEEKALDPETGFATNFGDPNLFAIKAPSQSDMIVDESAAYLGEALVYKPEVTPEDLKTFTAQIRFLWNHCRHNLHGLFGWRSFPQEPKIIPNNEVKSDAGK